MSTLGGNISPISKNVMQNFTTTGNLVGAQAMARGAGQLLPRMGEFANLLGKGVKAEKAFQRAFPEYYSQFGFEHTLSALTKGDLLKEIGGARPLIQGGWEKAKAALMGPFAVSEKFNRLWSFYGTREWGLMDPKGPVEVGKIVKGVYQAGAGDRLARNVTMMSQFGGGAIGQPTFLRRAPALLRQFAHFPARYMEWLYNSLALGNNPEVRSWSTIGKTMMTSSAIYHTAKNVAGVDLSGGLVSGSLPLPAYEGSPFYPLPIVPPALAIVGDVAKMGISGDFSNIGRVGAMAVPGGLAARRAWRAWAPRYAGYDKRTPGGKIPIYNQEGALLKYETPMELTMRGIGIQTMGRANEQETKQWLIKQRDILRMYRRNFAEAIVTGDTKKANQLRAEFAKKYPELGKLDVKKSDLTALQNRKQITRIQQVLKGMRAEDRPVFEQAANMAIAGHMGDSLDQNGTYGFAF